MLGIHSSLMHAGYSLPIMQKGYPSDSAAYSDPNLIASKLPIVMQKTQKLKIPN
jgi:hypothetical protein